MRGGRNELNWLAAGAVLLASAAWHLFAQETQPAPPRDPLEMLQQQVTQHEQAATAPGPSRLQGRFPGHGSLADPVRVAQLAPILTDEQVVASINQGVNALLRYLDRADPRGGTPADHHAVGEIGAAVYALLQAGKTINDPRLRFSSNELKPAVDWLLRAQTTQTYDAAFQASALSLLPPRPEFRKELDRVKRQIINAIQANGAFGYEVADAVTNKVPAGHPGVMINGREEQWKDNSNTQYALLGIWSAAEADVEVDRQFWRLSDGHWRSDQLPDGAWPYQNYKYPGMVNEMGEGRPTMTVAGVASLYVTTDQIGIPVRLNPLPDKALDTGLARVGQDFNAEIPELGDNLYYLFGLERVGLASGRHYLSGKDWFRQGAAAIILSQSEDGDWGEGGPYVGFLPVISTSYALLFLTHGRNPIAFNKLQYHGPWDARPRDDANLTRWLGRQLERPLNWEITDSHAPLADWLDAPVLLITGHGDPNFNPQEIAKFRDFVQAGGMIFSTADGDDAVFTKAITDIMAQMLDRRFEPRALPRDHVLYSLEFKLKTRPQLIGLSNGLREVWVHSPQDMGAFWAARNPDKPEYYQIPGNIYLYAIGQTNHRTRLQSVLVPATTAPSMRKISLARLRYSGNWDPEPAAWPRLALLFRADNMDLRLQTLDLKDLDAGRFPLVHMTGSTKFTLTPDSQDRVKRFLEGGGTLIVDAAGSSDAFIASFNNLLAALYPKNSLEKIDASDVIFNGSLPDTVKIDEVEYRPANRRPGWEHSPDLRGLKLHGRWAVLFSSPDITSGLLGTNTWGIAGYKAPSAIAVARDLILFAIAR